MVVHKLVGSPPRVWGIHNFISGCRHNIGSPPRVWGIRNAYHMAKGAIGSPPRVWGILHIGRSRCVVPRFTPTCVGNTPSASIRRTDEAVHPHVCGEYLVNRTHSQPRRPCNDRPVAIHHRPRFTPTCVGNTWQLRHSADLAAVHPHVCGEYVILAATLRLPLGSPPRVWGIRCPTRCVARLLRFTPTLSAARLDQVAQGLVQKVRQSQAKGG